MTAKPGEVGKRRARIRNQGTAEDVQWMQGNCMMRRPDRRPIYDWARDHIVELPSAYAIRGRFEINNSPWLKAPLDSMLDPMVRHTTLSKAIQSAGTLAAEIATAYRIANDPGPCTFTCQSEEMATLEAKTRMMPLLESIDIIRRVLPRPGPLRTQTEVFFPGGLFLLFNSANITHQQSQSVRYKINDEIWMPRWADVYDDACKRVTAFHQQGTSHILDISQGGFLGDHADASFKKGTMEEWSAECPSCKKSMPLHIDQTMVADPKMRAGLVWEEDAWREDMTLDETRVQETARFRCPHCAHEMPDSDATRAAWKRTGHYVCTREKPPKDRKSYHWEAPIAHPLSDLAREFAQAHNLYQKYGDDSEKIKFKQKREARSWVPKEEMAMISTEGRSDYGFCDYAGGEKIEDELDRCMTVDRQRGAGGDTPHWWAEARAWNREGSSKQLWFGRLNTVEEVEELRTQLGIEPIKVIQDAGYDTNSVYLDALRFGWSCWFGDKRTSWAHIMPDKSKILLPYSPPQRTAVPGGTVIYMRFSQDYAKDVLARLMRGRGQKWEIARDTPESYLEHCKAEVKTEVSPGVWTWKPKKQKIDNHGWDCSVMQVVFALVRKILIPHRFAKEDTQESADE
jgi:hypothetical protein